MISTIWGGGGGERGLMPLVRNVVSVSPADCNLAMRSWINIQVGEVTTTLVHVKCPLVFILNHNNKFIYFFFLFF